MAARARGPQTLVPAWHSAPGRHVRTGDSTAQGGLNYREPFEVDIGRPAVIVVWLRKAGYQYSTADVVTAELARAAAARGCIGRSAPTSWRRRGGSHEPDRTG